MLKISQAAKILGVSSRTLMRWDEDGKFPAHKEPISKMRYYSEDEIKTHALWFEIRRKHKKILNELDAIRAEVDKYIVTQPLDYGEKPKFHKLEDMKKAFDDLHKWERKQKEIYREFI